MTSKQIFYMTIRIQIERRAADAAVADAAGFCWLADVIRRWIVATEPTLTI